MPKEEAKTELPLRCRECEADTEREHDCRSCDYAVDRWLIDTPDRIQLCKMLKHQAIKRFTQELK